MSPMLTFEAAGTGGSSTGGGPVRFPLPALITRYITTRKRRGEFSEQYAANVRRVLITFAATTKVEPRKVTRAHIQRFLERPELAASTRRTHLSVLRNFFKWAAIEGHVRRDPTLGVTTPRQPPSIPGALTSDKAEQIHVQYQRLDPRVRLMVSFELNDALRRVEVARAQISDIDRRAGAMRVRGKARGGRGDITHMVALSAETLAAIDAYLSSEPGILGIPSLASGPLFRNRYHPADGISAQYVGVLVTRALYELGVKEAPRDGVSGHALRHTAATEALEAGVPMPIVQRQLGHQYQQTTSIYTKGASFELQEFHQRRKAKRRRKAPDVIDLRENE